MRRIPGGEAICGATSGAAAYAFASATLYKEATGEIVTVLGFIMAAFIPTMLLAATTLRAGRFSTARLIALSQALDRQISVLGGLFLYALAACTIVVAGKVANWSLPPIHVHLSTIDLVYDPSRFFTASITGLLVFVGLRSLALVGGVRSILRLTATMAIDEAGEKNEQQFRAEREIPERGGSLARVEGTVTLHGIDVVR